MTFFTQILRTHKQLFVLLLWIIFVGWTLWLHAQQSLQPPIFDAATYYLKAYNFWTEVHKHTLFNPFNVQPSFRPLGTILMSYPFGFDIDYRGFYFRSVFLPVIFLNIAIIIGGYQRELDSKSKWYLVLFAAFLSSLPCFYYFEISPKLPAPSFWGLVDNFLAGVAALATAATVRSILVRSLMWIGVAAILSSFCLLIKPSGVLIMMLIGLIWLGLTLLQLKSVWSSPDGRKSTIRWLLYGMIIFAVPYLLALAGSLTSDYLSSENLAFGNGAITIMKSELPLTWSSLLHVIPMGLGYPFVIWLFLMIILVGNYLWRTPTDSLPWTKPFLVGLTLASCTTFIFGIWFWIFGSGGSTQIRYFIPFAFMAMILALPTILTTMRAMSSWKMVVLSILMIAPIINIGMLLPQHDASIAWQKWTGVSMTSGVSDPVRDQAQNFASVVKQNGHDVTLYSMSMGAVDANFQSVVDYTRISMSPMPIISIFRPVDWQRPTTYRKEEMLNADYWLFQPERNSSIVQAVLATSLVNDFDQERTLFQAWATQLTTKEGVTVISDIPTARIVRISDPTLLESAFDALVAKHHWRSTFIEANPKRRFSEEDVKTALALNPASLENINFESHFQLRAFSASRTGDDTTVRFWWRPLSPLLERDWVLFIHSIDNEGKIVVNNQALIYFNRSFSSLNGTFLFEQITLKNSVINGTHRLAIGFVRPNQTPLIADKGTRDWDNRRVIIPLP